MKITGVKNIHVMSEKGRPMLLVKVETDVGIHGLGEIGRMFWGPAIVNAVNHLTELIVGENPFSTEKIWQHLWRRAFFPADGVYACAISAIDIALWDIKGKALEMPVYELLGGPVRDKVVCYPHNDGRTNDELTDSCRRSVDEGWRFVRWGLPETGSTIATEFGKEGVLEPVDAIPLAAEQMGLVRQVVGPNVQICIDVHTRMDTTHAVSLCKELEPFKPFFVEDPLRSESPTAYRALARRVNLPVAAGEQWSGKWAFKEVIEEGLIDYARIDVCNVGGLTEALKIVHSCETHFIDIAPHNPLGPVSAAACVALCMASTNVGVQEMPVAPGTVDVDLFPQQIGWKDGYAFCQEVPGLGVEIDEDVAEHRRTVGSGFSPLLRRNDGAFTNW
jgi:galactonate dehydratase